MNTFEYIEKVSTRQKGDTMHALRLLRAHDHFVNQWKRGWRINAVLLENANRVMGGNGKTRDWDGFGLPPQGSQLFLATRRWTELVNSGAVDVADSRSLFDNPTDIADFMVREYVNIMPFHSHSKSLAPHIWNFLNETIEDPIVPDWGDDYFGK